MRTLLGILAVAGLVGLTACDGTRAVTGPSFDTMQSNSANPEVPAGQHPQPNPNKAKSTHGHH